MGRASSAKKVARANKAARRPGARRSLAWPATITGVVALGVGLILFTIGQPAPPVIHPVVGDHWHAAYGIDNCGTFIPPLADVTTDVTGIHTHQDGLIHIHPFSSTLGGKNANLATWGLTTGLELTDTSIKAQGINVKNGDDCNGKPGVVKVRVWTNLNDPTGHLLTSNFNSFAPQDQAFLTIAFLPEGDEVPKPPDAALANLDHPADLATSGATTTTTVAPTTTTTVAK
jgi:hypothetical protein